MYCLFTQETQKFTVYFVAQFLDFVINIRKHQHRCEVLNFFSEDSQASSRTVINQRRSLIFVSVFKFQMFRLKVIESEHTLLVVGTRRAHNQRRI